MQRVFTLRVRLSDHERKMLSEISREMERNQSDTTRQLIREQWRTLQQDKTQSEHHVTRRTRHTSH